MFNFKNRTLLTKSRTILCYPAYPLQGMVLKTMIKGILPILILTAQFSASAQNEEPSEPLSNAIQRIETESNGNISIDIPDAIIEKLLNPMDQQKRRNITDVLRPGINKMSGFRIQVFSDGRNQYTLESRAKARGSAILAKFPKYRGQIYTYSQSPNWYTRVGNFRTTAEASAALAELKKAFPSFAREMRIVKSKIVVIK